MLKSLSFRLLFATLLIAAVVSMVIFKPLSKPAPNILLIVADDLGYSDLGLLNPELTTPSLDQLAQQGVRFTRHYADATCSPTRVGLLTGQHPARLGFRPVQQGISNDQVTLPKQMAEAGYKTAHIGKWHIGNSIAELSPKQAGFDSWFGFLTQFELSGNSKDGIRFKWPRYKNPWIQSESTENTQLSGHLTDILTDKAISTIEGFNKTQQPWFLNLWYYAPHAPIKPAKRFAEKYPDTAKGRYQALIEQLDFSVGRITDKLQQLGLDENTLIVFVSDNGGTNRDMPNNQPLFGRKTEFNEGGVRTPMIWRWTGQLPANKTINHIVSYLDIMPTLSSIAGQDINQQKLDGENLWPAVNQQQAFPERYLHWEYLAPLYHSFSVLDKGGRWRLVKDHTGKTALYDIENPKENDRNVLEQQPQVAQRLMQEYERWRAQAHRVDVTTQALNTQGAAIISGQGVQRSPGYSAFTFAIGVTPLKTDREQQTREHIVNQPPYWQLGFKPGQPLTLDMLGESLQGPVLPKGECSAVVVSSHFSFSRIWPDTNFAVIDLYINGERVASINKKNPKLAPADFDKPTFIGVENAAAQPAAVHLSEPYFFNEAFIPAKNTKLVSNNVETLTKQLCPPNSGKATL